MGGNGWEGARYGSKNKTTIGVYVAFVIDAFSRRIVGWRSGHLDDHRTGLSTQSSVPSSCDTAAQHVVKITAPGCHPVHWAASEKPSHAWRRSAAGSYSRWLRRSNTMTARRSSV